MDMLRLHVFFYHLAKILLKCFNRGPGLTTKNFHHCTDTFFSFVLFFGKLLVIMKPDNKL